MANPTVCKSFNFDTYRLDESATANGPGRYEVHMGIDVTAAGPLLDRSGYMVALLAIERTIGGLLRSLFHHRLLVPFAHERTPEVLKDASLRLRTLILQNDGSSEALARQILCQVIPKTLREAELYPSMVQVRTMALGNGRAALDPAKNAEAVFWLKTGAEQSNPFVPENVSSEPFTPIPEFVSGIGRNGVANKKVAPPGPTRHRH